MTLPDAELTAALATLPHWSLRDGMLVREWRFADFTQAMHFVHQVAALAEAANHHPDIDIRYARVRLALVSHDSGGITRRDIDLAAQLDTLAL
ncbi:MAG: 4a-hydroxytetrahydrobiopterin dehydratase [Acidobacteriota bacterium]|nr:4a-hydroxytetrahydrobiopterin dehydratase [Acidobacteriota bacterium]